MEVKLPKPGDQLPFVVLTMKGGCEISYDEDGILRFNGHQDQMWMGGVAELLGIPEEFPVQRTSAVAPTEGGEE